MRTRRCELLPASILTDGVHSPALQLLHGGFDPKIKHYKHVLGHLLPSLHEN